MTIAMVTHEADIARYAGRVIVVRDGKILSDQVQQPVLAVPPPATAPAASAGEARP
jgi:putative ABC transport system ATP-binding protein